MNGWSLLLIVALVLLILLPVALAVDERDRDERG